MADKMYRHETAANAASLAQSNLMSGRKADVDAATIAHQRDVAESRRQEGGTYNEPKQAWYIESNDPFTAIYRDDGMLVDAATMQPPEGQYTTVNPYSKSGRATAGKGSGEDDPMVKVGKPDLVYDIITSDLLGPATGILDLQQWVGRGGYDSPFSDKGTGVGVQSLHSKMADVGIDQVKSNLEGLGVNPTDKDLTVAFASIPGRFTQPQGWIDWVKDQYLPLLNKSINDARAAGTLDEEGAAAMYNKTVQGIEIAQQKLDGLDEAKAEAEGGAEQPKYNSKGWKLQQDRDSGDLAYVNPDNPNEFEEVP
jgi:hypothetical protein